MRLSHLAACVATLSLGAVVGAIPTNNSGNYIATCKAIESAISSASGVFYPGSATYAVDIKHWNPTSTLNSTCSVEPGNVADVQAIMKILGKTTTPFAIKAGGHTFNQHFSSTLGIQIALTRLNEVTYDNKSNTVTLGMGNTWTAVYSILEKINITVSGGRIDGVGVGGFLLGGGYSYLSSQSGLSMDNVISFQVVLPSGKVATASSNTNPDLFWGLKGGFNNFGIVTSAVLKAFPLGQVYGGQLIYTGASLELLPAAVASYAEMQNSTNAVPKAGLVVAYRVAPGSDPTAVVQIFYDGVNPPDRLLAPFKAIPADSSSLAVYSLTDFIAVVSVIFGNPDNDRSASTTISVHKVTVPVISKFWNITENLASSFPHAKAAVVMFEPFVPNAITRPLSDGVFPHDVYASPLNAALQWTDPAQDAAGLKALDRAADKFESVLRKIGEPVDQMMLYPNYADADHRISELYGPNLARAKALRAKIDPKGVMLRTGGWKFV